MADLKTTYMGIELKNPLIVSSSGITGSLDGVKKSADHGAGAVVLKSMFEEIIHTQSEELDTSMLESIHTEAYDYVQSQIGMQMGTKPYLSFIENAKKSVDIPVIASVNCTSPKWWASYAKDIESAGADGLELNISHFPKNDGESSADIEQQYADIVNEVSGHISIPVAVKVSYFFTSLWNVLSSLDRTGIDALVLFNRFYTVDVDIHNKRIIPAIRFSCSNEMYLPLKWVALASETFHCDIAASTGVHNAESIAKMIMAGASAVQVCSVLYRHGTVYIEKLLKGLDKLMERECVACVADLKGLAIRNTPDSDKLLHRMQYIRALNEASKYEF